jgi:hypothetical protein
MLVDCGVYGFEKIREDSVVAPFKMSVHLLGETEENLSHYSVGI